MADFVRVLKAKYSKYVKGYEIEIRWYIPETAIVIGRKPYTERTKKVHKDVAEYTVYLDPEMIVYCFIIDWGRNIITRGKYKVTEEGILRPTQEEPDVTIVDDLKSALGDITEQLYSNGYTLLAYDVWW